MISQIHRWKSCGFRGSTPGFRAALSLPTDIIYAGSVWVARPEVAETEEAYGAGSDVIAWDVEGGPRNASDKISNR